jgi:hypothetical protein
MRILIQGDRLDKYLAKCHEALRTGLRALFDTRCFGRGYSGYWPASLKVRTFPQMIRHVFPECVPDLLFTQDIHLSASELAPKYEELENVGIKKTILLADYWGISEKDPQILVDFVSDYNIDLIYSYFPQPLAIWSNTAIGNKLRYLPPCFDPRIFNNWKMPKEYDVGFLAAGTLEPMPKYPERYKLHQQLLQQRDLKYLWAAHPGWKLHGKNSPLVGRNFSRAINSCRIFITTGGVLRNAHSKYIEALASHTLLMADEPVGAESLGLVDNINYVCISEDNVLEKVRYYLARPELCYKIAEEGYRLAMTKHNCFVRANDFFLAFLDYLGGEFPLV